MRLLFILLAASTLQAEFLHIEVVMKDMNCASCSDSLGKAFERIRGVKHVEVSMEKRTVILELIDQNKVTLDQVWDTVKRIGFTPGDTKVVVRGDVNRSLLKVNEKTFVIEGVVVEGANVDLRGLIVPPPDPRTAVIFKVQRF